MPKIESISEVIKKDKFKIVKELVSKWCDKYEKLSNEVSDYEKALKLGSYCEILAKLLNVMENM